MSSLGEVLETARRASRKSQEDVATAAFITQAALSRYEHDIRQPSRETLEQLGVVLGVTADFLSSTSEIEGAMAIDVHMRRRKTAQPTVWKGLEARLNMHRAHMAQMIRSVPIEASRSVPSFDPEDTPPDVAARLVRMQWRMPSGPVRHLYRWLESAGCLVLEEDFGTQRVDGLSQLINGHPVLLLNSTAPQDRKRLTAAHELGHIVLHCVDVTDSIEDDADAFAAEFLMPAEVIRPQLRNVTIGKLVDLKQEWGVSMQALLERAYHLGLIGSEQRTRFYKMMSARGWRTSEPGSELISPEQPKLVTSIGAKLLSVGLSNAEIAQLAGYQPDRLDLPFIEQPRLRLL